MTMMTLQNLIKNDGVSIFQFNILVIFTLIDGDNYDGCMVMVNKNNA
jgi:archaellum component FlaG (FlaF/FlaG flagellin family)